VLLAARENNLPAQPAHADLGILQQIFEPANSLGILPIQLRHTALYLSNTIPVAHEAQRPREYNVGYRLTRHIRFFLLLTISSLIYAQADRDARPIKNPLAQQPEAVDAGKSHFGEACAACHGANAEGGRGPNLVQSGRLRRMTDDQLFNTIRRGVPGGGMPAFPLPDTNIWQIVTYLRSLSTPAFLVPIAGDPKAGAEIYRRQHCESCHMLNAQGGFLGPDLTDIAASLTVKQIRESLIHPNENPVNGFSGVTVTLNDGTRITGVAKNDSNYAIDILDASGALHLLDMSQVKDVQFAPKSLMPSYAQTLSAADLQNLIAFLSRQTVRPDARIDQKIAAGEEH
jgi:putative heme-binding domain-containing protein